MTPRFHPAPIAVALAATLLLVPATAAADTELGTTGLVGPHTLRDREPAPGLRCTYADPSNVLQSMRIRPPIVRARDVTGGRDHQWVSWVVTVRYWDVNEFWAVASRHGPWGARAWDDTPAELDARTVEAPIGLGGSYRAVVTMRWHRAGLIEGRSRHRVDWVRLRVPGVSAETVGPAGTCPEVLAG